MEERWNFVHYWIGYNLCWIALVCWITVNSMFNTYGLGIWIDINLVLKNTISVE